MALVFAGLALLQALFSVRLGMKGFSYARFFPRKDAPAGACVEYVEVIRNSSLFFLPWVRLETRMPPSFAFDTREEVDIRSGHFHKSVFTLFPRSQVTRRHKVMLTRRGHFVLSSASLTAGDLLGWRPETRELEAAAEIFVYPALLEEADAALPFFQPQGEQPVFRWIQPDPFLISGIRPYRAGDPERDIHWAASARTGEWQVKTHDFTADPRLLVLINAQTSESQWDDLSPEQQGVVEYAISLAATWCVSALDKGMEAGFGTNMPLDEQETSAYLPPARGAGRSEELLRAFASLRVRRTLSFPTFLEQLPRPSGAEIILLSCYDSELIQAQADALRKAGNSVSLFLLPEVEHG